jgi:nitroreductase
MNILEAIKERSSVRNYKNSLTKDEIKRVRDIVLNSEQYQSLEPQKPKLFLVEGKTMEKLLMGFVGGYGKIKNAPMYMAAVGRKDNQDALNIGYVMEQIILKLKQWGFDTCWVGGAFQEKSLREYLKINEDEEITAISPIGYSAEKSTIFEAGLRAIVGSKNRKKLEEICHSKTYGNTAKGVLAQDPILREAMELVRISPSAMNLQPWSFVLGENSVVVLRKLSKIQGDLSILDMGIAMAHIDIAFGQLIKKGRWQLDVDNTDNRLKYNVPEGYSIVSIYKC